MIQKTAYSPILITGIERSGIYRIQSILNNKRYIGSASNLKTREKDHFNSLRNKKHHSILLQRHYNKYGIEDLQFSIIEFCEKEKLIEREQFWMDEIKPEFNICKIAGSALGVKRTEESLNRISLQRKEFYKTELGEQVKKKISLSLIGKMAGKNNPNYGKHHSDEAKEKISKNAKGRVAWSKGLTKETDERVRKQGELCAGKVVSEDVRLKISNTLTGRKATKETIEKLQVFQRNRWKIPGEREKQSERIFLHSGMRGKFHSEETKKRMSDSHKKYYEKQKINEV